MNPDRLGLGRPLAKLDVNFPLCLAPMVGLSHVATRELLKHYMPANARTIWPTEMLSSKRLPVQKMGATPEVTFALNESNLVPQILGNEQKSIAASCKKLEQWGAVAIDINMGCPVKKALRHNYGVALMGDSEYAARVVEMTVSSTSLPVSVKLRAGQQRDLVFLKNFCLGLQQAGASWICLHPRTGEQKRRGQADWEMIGWLREQLKIPVIGNGDIQTIDDVIELLKQTHCDLAMAGRALLARPWMLWQLGRKLGFEDPVACVGDPPETPFEEAKEYGLALQKLLSLFREYFPEDLGLRKFKFYIKVSSPWLEWSNNLWGTIDKAKTYDEIEIGLISFFTYSGHKFSKNTNLRY